MSIQIMFSPKNEINTFSQTNIKEVMRKAGLGEFAGICQGIALDGTLAIFNPEDDIEFYLLRLHLAHLIGDKYPRFVNRAREVADNETITDTDVNEQPDQTTKEILANKKALYAGLIAKLSDSSFNIEIDQIDKLKLTSYECDIITEEIKPFLKEIKLCQEAKNGETIPKNIQSAWLKDKGYLHCLTNFIGTYSNEDCANSFITFFKNLPANFALPFSILMTSCNHTIAILHIPKIGLVFLNAALLSDTAMVMQKKTEVMPNAIIPSFSFNGIVALSTEIYCALADAPIIEKALNEWISKEKNKTITNQDILRKDSFGGSLLYIAVMVNDNTSVRALLELGADPNDQIKGGATALFLAAQEGFLETATLLLENPEKKADPNLARDDGATPLFVAIKRGHTKMVALLLAHKADPNITWNGISPRVAAEHYQHKEIINLLDEHEQQQGNYIKQTK